MRVSVVGAGDESDPALRHDRGRSDRRTRREMVAPRKVARGRDHDDLHRRGAPTTHEPERNQRSPIHRRDGSREVVRPEAHADRAEAGRAEGLEHPPRQLRVRREVELDRWRDAVEPPGYPIRDDHAQGVANVDVVRRGDDRNVWFRTLEEPA